MGLSLIESNRPYGQMDVGQQFSDGFVITRRNSFELLEFGEEVFDDEASVIGLTVIVAGYFAIRFRRNHHRFILVREQGNHPFIGVEGLSAKSMQAFIYGNR